MTSPANQRSRSFGSGGTDPSEHSGVLVPPALIYLGTLGLAVWLESYVGQLPTGLGPEWRHMLAMALVAVAVPLLAGALGQFHQAGTRPEPWKPSTAIVSTGVYRFTRNPIYCGYGTDLCRTGVAVGQRCVPDIVAPFVAGHSADDYPARRALPGAEVR